jgi:hypothetical protein
METTTNMVEIIKQTSKIIKFIKIICSHVFIGFMIEYEIKPFLKIEWFALNYTNKFVYLFVFLKFCFNFFNFFDNVYDLYLFICNKEDKHKKWENRKINDVLDLTFYTGMLYMHYRDCHLHSLLQNIVFNENYFFFQFWKFTGIVLSFVLLFLMCWVDFYSPDCLNPLLHEATFIEENMNFENIIHISESIVNEPVQTEAFMVEEEPNVIQAVLAQ